MSPIYGEMQKKKNATVRTTIRKIYNTTLKIRNHRGSKDSKE